MRALSAHIITFTQIMMEFSELLFYEKIIALPQAAFMGISY